MSVKIHHSVVGDGPNVVLLHGLFGMGSNLGALARALQDDYRVHSIDLPNHGRSGWLEDAGLAALAGVITGWLEDSELGNVALVGHSLGGKIAMQIALADPARVDSLVVADIAPVEYPSHHDQVFAALDAVCDAACQSRAEAAELMAGILREEDVIQFLLMSLYRTPDGTYQWRFNLKGLKENYVAVRHAPEASGMYGGEVLFVKGGDSDYILPEHEPQIRALFPSASVKIMQNCGHWLHAQQPRLFNSIVKRFLDAQR